MAKEKAIGMPRAIKRKKAAKPKILIIRGDNLILLSHLREKVNHLDNELKAKNESP
jgi:hypothetical protein